MKKLFPVIILIILCIFFIGVSNADAQCPMCRMSAESNLQHGGSAGKGLNTGILYILSIPYILVASLGFIWYKNRKKEVLEEEEDLI